MNIYIHSSILLGLTVTLLSGCGFSPMYGNHAPTTENPSSPSVAANLSQIDISIIPDREGQMLRNDLMDRFYRSGYPSNPIATLNIAKVNQVRTELDLTKSSDATRAQLRVYATMTLVGRDGSVLLQRDVQSVTSFNILGSEFATRVTENAARENAINELARQIELNLSIYYNDK